MEYTPYQQEAIDHLDGNLQIIACAGSGKTQVISQRIVNILREKGPSGIEPANIVAFTFTDKAAGELKDRIHKLAREQLASECGFAEMYVGTIHGFCLDMLQKYLFKFLKYSVISDVQQRLLIDRYSRESGMSDLATTTGRKLQRWKDSKLYQKVLSMIREVQIDEVALGAHPILSALAKYHALLDKKRYLDYSRILLEAVTALRDNEVLREKIDVRVKYLVVDEYQDVNPLQEILIRQLHDLGAQLCVVGDDDQTIYRWNGSDSDNILTFSKRYPGVRKVHLTENFRSSRGIVETGKSVIERNATRLPKDMISRDKQRFVPGDILSLRFAGPSLEANWIVEKITNMRGVPFEEDGITRGLSWKDCAILLRSVRGSALPIIEALRAENVPYIVKGMTGLFDTHEVQAAAAIFDYLANDIDRETVIGLWNTANLGLSPEKIVSAVAMLDQRKLSWIGEWRRSLYSIQRTFLDFLKAIGLREEAVPDGCSGHGSGHRPRGEIVYYNLGKFSQLISDYESVNFNLDPANLYKGFAGFLRYQAAQYYPEGWEGAGFALPDAVQVMTVHQAKGMEFPLVFIPNLLRNRFPSKKQGGRKWSHVIPRVAVIGAARYDGCEEDERRLFYVALTRSKKYLYCSWAPESSGGLYVRQSQFVREVTAPSCVLTREPAGVAMERIPPQAATEEAEVILTFSELKYFYECPYQFKLRFMYGFNPGFHEKIGFGKSLHDALAEAHRKALDGQYLKPADVPHLLDTHFHLPYAWRRLTDDMRRQAERALRRYLGENSAVMDKVEFAEQAIELRLAEGIVVHGRIDLIRRTDTSEVSIIDFKSTERSREEEITREQLRIYALGYQHITGNRADLVEIYNLDRGARATVRELVDDAMLQQTEKAIVAAGREIKSGDLRRKKLCPGCDFQGICRSDIKA
ncbi:MAG: ATP-dependent DNA helicase [Syntrophobacteraceae bacterium]|nr:ATP-dependent DNA helicase [Syntrophobacteraceae bacterium]